MSVLMDTVRSTVYGFLGELRRRVRASIISLRLVTHQLVAATVVTVVDVTFNFVSEVVESFFTLVDSLVALVIGRQDTPREMPDTDWDEDEDAYPLGDVEDEDESEAVEAKPDA